MGFPPDEIAAAEQDKRERVRFVAQSYWNSILSRLSSKSRNKWVAIDLTTGEYEMADDQQEAVRNLEARFLKAMVWVEKVPPYHRTLR